MMNPMIEATLRKDIATLRTGNMILKERVDSLLAEIERLESIKQVSVHGVPEGCEPVEAWVKDGRIAVLGYPEGMEDRHDCDEMGCGQSHVIAWIDDPRVAVPTERSD